ncbi:hypothetical protein BHM03_00015959 [Ensete ventricosum]|uniref:phosphatidate cytidylyltransferase n=1 Tax=Ensete ventricosum TaxID=4639 RepID=A0A445MEK6_ENSVE|nr:hypothetical protein BHM03_00015959 [Ensete ventricosum]
MYRYTGMYQCFGEEEKEKRKRWWRKRREEVGRKKEEVEMVEKGEEVARGRGRGRGEETYHGCDLSIGWLHCDPGPLFRPEYFSLPALMHQWDFGDSIPGHGGITDRMDCQVSCWSLTYLLNSSALPRQFVYLVVNLFPRCIVLQMVMAVFAYIYHQSFVMPPSFSLEMFLDQVSWFHTFLYLFCFLVFY